MIHEYTLKTADAHRQLVDQSGQPLRFMRYLFAESTMKFRRNLFVHAQGGPEPLPDHVDLIICTAGINWDVSLSPLDPPAVQQKTVQSAPASPPTPETTTLSTSSTTPPPAPESSRDASTIMAAPSTTTSSKATNPAKPIGPLAVACPSCHQQSGVLCTTKDGKPTSSHKLRIAAAKAIAAPDSAHAVANDDGADRSAA
jgi:hypothetical protein